MASELNVFALLAGTAFVAGLACDVIVILSFARPRQMRVGPKPWGIRELALATAVVLGLLVGTNCIYGIAASLTNRDFEALSPVIIPVELVLRLVLLAGFAAFFRRERIALRPALGLDNIPAPIAIRWGLIFGLASLPPVGLLLLASEALCRYVGLNPSEQPIAELFTSTNSKFLLGTLTLFALIVAPVFEEFFFRGFAYPALKQRLGAGRALAIVSAVFAATHVHAPSFVPLFALALGLGLAYELTGSLLTSMTMHSLFNGLMILRLFHERAHS